MSRLDSFINRMCAQRDILNHLRDGNMLPDEGIILEFGLGNGRTYSHMRECFPGRRIVTFDRQLAAHSSTTPEPEDYFEGEVEQTGKLFIGAEAALAHADIGTGHRDRDAVTLAWLPQMMVDVLATGGIAICGLPIDHPRLQPLPRLPTVAEDRYFYYRKI